MERIFSTKLAWGIDKRGTTRYNKNRFGKPSLFLLFTTKRTDLYKKVQEYQEIRQLRLDVCSLGNHSSPKAGKARAAEEGHRCQL